MRVMRGLVIVFIFGLQLGYFLIYQPQDVWVMIPFAVFYVAFYVKMEANNADG